MHISVLCVCAYANFEIKLCATYSFNNNLVACLCLVTQKKFG